MSITMRPDLHTLMLNTEKEWVEMEQTYGNYPQSQGLGHFGSFTGGSQPYYDDDMDMMHYGSMGQMGPDGSIRRFGRAISDGWANVSGAASRNFDVSGHVRHAGVLPAHGDADVLGLPRHRLRIWTNAGLSRVCGYGNGHGTGMMHGYYPGMAGRDCHC